MGCQVILGPMICKKTHIFLILICLIPGGVLAGPLDEIRRNPQWMAQVQEVILGAVENNFGKAQTLPQDLGSPLQKPQALFVTAKKDGRVRGCMGTLQAKEASLAEEIVVNLQKAFSQDPRHHPIQKSETSGMEIFLTVVGKPIRVHRVDTLNPARDSVLIRHGNKTGVVLAGEAKTLRYLLAFAKAKAGIKKGEPYQVFRLPSQTLSWTLP